MTRRGSDGEEEEEEVGATVHIHVAAKGGALKNSLSFPLEADLNETARGSVGPVHPMTVLGLLWHKASREGGMDCSRLF